MFHIIYSFTGTVITGGIQRSKKEFLLQEEGCSIVTRPDMTATFPLLLSQHSPSSTFSHEDFWYGLLLVILYGLFYVLVLDRFGVYIYPVFSPRSTYFPLTWISPIGILIACFKFWNYMLVKYEFLYCPFWCNDYNHDDDHDRAAMYYNSWHKCIFDDFQHTHSI
jgi:hypothetical protein